jgi:hypothetical protein
VINLPGNMLPRTPRDQAADQDFRAVLRRIGQLESASMFDLGQVSGAVTVDFTEGAICKMELGGNVTLTVNGYVAGRSYFLVIEQGASAYTVTWPSDVKWAAGVGLVPSTGSGDVDIISMIALDLGTPALYAVGQKDFS